MTGTLAHFEQALRDLQSKSPRRRDAAKAAYPALATACKRDLNGGLMADIRTWRKMTELCQMAPRDVEKPPKSFQGLLDAVVGDIGERPWERLHDAWCRLSKAMNGRNPLEYGHSGLDHREDDRRQYARSDEED